MSARRADVLVIGGGLAGLSAARHLVDAGASVLVLEARDRVGGRTLSRTFGKGVFDLGGQWIGPGQTRMHRLVEELGIATFPTFAKGRRVLEVGGRVKTYKGMIPSLPVWSLLGLQRAIWALEKLGATVPLDDPASARRAVELDGMTVETWKRRYLPFADARGTFDIAVRTIFGAEPAELSMLQFLFYARSGGGLESLVEVENGAQQTRFVPGAQEVSLRLAARLGERIVLSAPARRLRQSTTAVTVTTDAGDFEGGRAVLAVPPTLAGRLVYEPELPWERDQLTQRVPMGATTKAIVLYDRAFWREAGLSGEAVSTDGPVTACFDNTSHDGAQPSLLAFLVGTKARTWGARPAAERKVAVLAALGRFFGAEAERPIDYLEQDWQAEPWTRGCPVGSPTPGTLTLFGAALRRPVDRLHFAGTETSAEWNGYMEGAVASGERAAAEVRAAG